MLQIGILCIFHLRVTKERKNKQTNILYKTQVDKSGEKCSIG